MWPPSRGPGAGVPPRHHRMPSRIRYTSGTPVPTHSNAVNLRAACCIRSRSSTVPHVWWQAPLPGTVSDLRSRSKGELAAMLRAMQLSDAGLKPELLQRLREAIQRQDPAVPSEAAPLAISARSTKAELRSLRKEQLAAALQTRGLDDKGLKPELVNRLFAASQQGGADDVASGGPSQRQQAPAAGDNVSPAHAAAASECSAVSKGGVRCSNASAAGPAGDAAAAAAAAPAVPAGQPAAAPAQATLPPAEFEGLLRSLPAGAPAAPDAAAHLTAARNAAVPAAAPAAAAPQLQPQHRQPGAPECDVPTGLSVQWLGTSSGAPTAQRNVSSILLLQRRRVLMVDCGEGTINQLATAGIDPILVKGYTGCEKRYVACPYDCFALQQWAADSSCPRVYLVRRLQRYPRETPCTRAGYL
jgi:hypothetical protein